MIFLQIKPSLVHSKREDDNGEIREQSLSDLSTNKLIVMRVETIKPLNAEREEGEREEGEREEGER